MRLTSPESNHYKRGWDRMILETMAVKAVATKLLALHTANAAAGASAAHGLGGIAAVHVTELGAVKGVGAATVHATAGHLATDAAVAAKAHITPLEAAGHWAYTHYRYFALPTAGVAGVAGAAGVASVSGAKAAAAKKLGKEIVHKVSQRVIQYDLDLIRERAEARALVLERASESGEELTTRQRAELEALRRLEPLLRHGGPSLAAVLAPPGP
jgi:hypothetical protein